jgi:2-polyprenyl-3-methyl-5-hydroxy-6-metoxy-1,4-benzoquinol methylase
MSVQKKSNEIYKDLSTSKKILPTEKAGRYKWQCGKEKIIFKDITQKLNLKKNDDLLDIGCGCGPLTDIIINYCSTNNINLTLCDIAPVIKILKKNYKKYKNLKFINQEFQKVKINKKYNKILCYSVIQCVDFPFNFVKKIILFMRKEGKALIGDIPNINKKYRFLISKFRKNYKNFNHLDSIEFKNFKKFKKTTKQNTKIDDNLVLKILSFSRKLNKSSTILKQNQSLPFSFTREDILIEEF